MVLSCGEQQHVGISRALVNRPPILLTDDLTGNLDYELSKDIMKLFERFNQVGVTVFIATHDHELINTLPYEKIALRHGNLTQ